MAVIDYVPSPVPPQADQLPAFLALELPRITVSDLVTLPQLYAAPPNPVDGMIAFADGTSWNPGGGQGIYAYYGAAWNKL